MQTIQKHEKDLALERSGSSGEFTGSSGSGMQVKDGTSGEEGIRILISMNAKGEYSIKEW